MSAPLSKDLREKYNVRLSEHNALPAQMLNLLLP